MILEEIAQKVRSGKVKDTKALVQQAIDEGIPAQEILEQGLVAGMNVIGELFKNNEVFVQASGKVCIGTVQGDLHDIGKNLVKMMLEGKGLEVIDLGTDVAPETFVETAKAEDCQIIACSALLTTTMGGMVDVVKAAEEAGIREKVKIMVGGAPITEEFCRRIGADAYTPDAASAANKAMELCRANGEGD